VRRAISPIAAIAWSVRVDYGTRAVIIARRTIRIRPAAPVDVIVISAARAPIPSPSAPAPRLVNHQRRDSNSDAETDQRSADDGGRTNVNDSGIVLRDVDDLRVGRLNHVDRLTRRRLLNLDLLLLGGLQCAGCVRVGAQPLDRGSHFALIGGKCGANRGVIIHVLRHHLQDLREIYQRDKCGIESLFHGGIGERRAAEIGILLQPIMRVENFLRVRGGGGDLREQGIGIERHGSQ
jgi:hypothetical protein